MPKAPQIAHVDYDSESPIMDRELIDMLLMDDGDGTDLTLARELFDLFATESARKLDALPAVCAESDTQKLREIVHFIAGSAGNLGLARLAAFYRGIERAIDGGELTDLTGCEAPIRQEFVYARDAFRADFNL